IKHVSCFGGDDAKVVVGITGGQEPYNYDLTVDGTTTSDVLSTAGTFTLTGLSEGMVSVSAIDNVSCGHNSDDTVMEPTELVTTASAGTILCFGDTTATVTTVTEGGTAPYSHVWSGTKTSLTETILNAGGGDYMVIATDDKDCIDTSYASIDSLTPIITGLSHDTVTCYEAGDGVLYATAEGGAGKYTYNWFFPNIDSLTTPNVFDGINGYNLDSSTYWVIISDTNNCVTDTLFEFVERPDSIRAYINISGAALGNSPFDVVFIDTSHGNYYNTWDWIIDNEIVSSDEDTVSQTFETPKTISYEIVLQTSRDGYCMDTDTMFIVVEAGSFLAIPDVFTPNGDDINDKFMVTYINICDLNGRIFNRWGEKLYEWNGVETGWDGRTLSGEEVPDGVYFFLIDAYGCDETEYLGNKGSVTIIR
ncbi:MAG: gliding motility-associated C-terminal domain-containing protein, partial [Flavobacteriales bacterium]|nr:gliding motility-associated C-terminal domain-containing protein [Flavobacteriales bacterium]